MKNGLKQIEAKESMIAALAHEIKNPLNSIKGANKFLHDKYKFNKEIYEFTGLIENEILRLERYLNEFMSFSRGIKLRLREVDLENYLKGIILMAKHGFKGDILIKKKKDKLPLFVADPELFRQVLDNLILNAKDAVSKKNNPKIEIIIDYNGKYFIFEIFDNGCGIKKNNLKKVFLPFYTTKSNGLGIGLSICNAIIKKHNGQISVKSVEKKWTRFIIKMPYIKRDN